MATRQRFAKLRVEQDGINDWRVWLNDEEITGYCHNMVLQFGAHDLTLVDLTLAVESVNVKTDAVVTEGGK